MDPSTYIRKFDAAVGQRDRLCKTSSDAQIAYGKKYDVFNAVENPIDLIVGWFAGREVASKREACEKAQKVVDSFTTK